MANLWNSLVEIAEASTRLTTMTGKAHPLLLWGDRGMESLPIIAGTPMTITPLQGAEIWHFQLDAYGPGWDGVASRLASELRNVITRDAFLSPNRSHPADALPVGFHTRTWPQLDEGRERVTLEFDVRLNT